MQGELTRCIIALRSIFPAPSPQGSAGGTPEAGAYRGSELNIPADDHDHPPELTHRTSGGRRNNITVDPEWLNSLAEEFNVVCEGVDGAKGTGQEELATIEGEGEAGHRGKDC